MHTGRLLSLLGAGILLTGVLGCESFSLQSLVREFREPRPAEKIVSQHRDRFLRERDPAAFEWLLTHMLENSMTVPEVDHVMGESGERVVADQHLKAGSGDVLQTDVAWKWGPTSDGQSVVLFFRDGRLVNFRSEQFVRFAQRASDSNDGRIE